MRLQERTHVRFSAQVPLSELKEAEAMINAQLQAVRSCDDQRAQAFSGGIHPWAKDSNAPVHIASA